MTKLVQQPSTSASDQPIPEVSARCDDQRQQSPQASSTPAKVASGTTATSTTPSTKKQQQSQLSRRTSTRLTSIRNDSLSSSTSSSSLSSAGDLETTTETKSTPTEDVFKVPSITAGSSGAMDDTQESGIVCRLPLDRLQAILGALNILKNPPDNETCNSSSPSPTYKLLCLYCDRTFTSQTLMLKHIDRVHRISKDRRSSSRVLPTTNDGAFPSCGYCNKSKVLNPASEDLSQLFKHLVHQHADRYYACELCAVRFPTDESRDAHIEALHPPASNTETRTRPKSKAALKSFNVKAKKCEIVTTPLTIQVDFDTEAMKNLTIENHEAVDSLSAALGVAGTSTGASSTRLRSSGRTSARSSALAGAGKSKVLRKSDKMMMRSNEPMLSRLGIAQHRTTRQCRKALNAKNRRKAVAESTAGSTSASASSSQPDNHYNKITKLKTIRSTLNNPSGSSESDFVVTRGKNDIVSTFDEDFYENVNLNVRQNLSCHLDGKLEASAPNAPSPMSPVAAVPAIRSTVVKSPLQSESKIHEATNLPAMTVFPTLLTVEQYGTDLMPMTKIKKPITKNSWKWKWDFVKKYKYVNENGKIVKKIKQPTLGLRDLSKLDMWTQLTMRTKHELMRNNKDLQQPGSSVSDIGVSLRKEQRKQVEELNKILDTRLIPQINLEQNDQSIIKLEREPVDDSEALDQYSETQNESQEMDESFTRSLNLIKIPANNQLQRVVLSGEWARPRCYICYCCGDRFHSLKQMEEHKTFRHPYVYSTYYEIVGRELIEKQLFKHFFIPLSALTMHRIHYARLSTYPSLDRTSPPARQPSLETSATITEIKSEDSSSNEATSFSTATSSSLLSISGNTATSSGSSASSRSALDTLLSAGNDYTTSFTNYPSEPGPVQCSKCQKECVNTLVLYAHVLNCSNDYIWMQAKKRMKNRRANRKRKRTNRASQAARKAHAAAAQSAVEKSETASNHSGAEIDGSSTSGSSSVSSDTKKKSKSPPRPRDSDSDIVKRITANLPPKRVSRQIIQTTKQIRKRPQMNIIKGKKQVVSTLAPSKAGVSRGATTVGVTKLRSGKIASIPGTNKKAVVKVATKKPAEKIESEAETESLHEATDSKQTEDDTKEDAEVVKTEETEEQIVSPVIKRKVLSRERTKLSVRTKNFVTRRNAVHWKGKTKVLPFRKGIVSNNRSLRSGAVKVLPSKRQTKNVSPAKKVTQENDNKAGPSSVTSVIKKNPSKRKGSKSPAELENNPDSPGENKLPEKEEKSESNEITKEVTSEITDVAVEDASTNEVATTVATPVIEEVPNENLKIPTVESSLSSATEDKVQPDVGATPAKDTEATKNDPEPLLKLKEVDTETPNQPILQEMNDPSTPVKSPKQGSQPPSEPTTPSFSASQQANKRKPKKLNDCIAMLTGKLSEKLGVDFFNQVASKNPAPKSSPVKAIETRSSKQVILPAPSLMPMPPSVSVPLHVTPPQLAPLPLVMNTRQSPVPPKPQMLSPIAPIVAPMDEISDEPLNLSKNSPIGRSIPTRSREPFSHQKTTNMMSPPPPQSPIALHSPQQLPTSHYHQPSQVQQQPGPSTPTRNLPSIKLPPGLIIERVEYKSRPTISKEAPSVTIVARRQPGPPPSIESRSTVLMPPVGHDPTPSPPHSSRKHSNPQQLIQHQQQQQQQYGDPRKSSTQIKPPQLPSPKATPQPNFPTPSIASTLRQERPLENRISVTITETKGDRIAANTKQPPVTLNIPERPLVLDRTASNINPSPLIIPSVPIPTAQPQSTSPNKKSRRKSMYVAPVSVPEPPSPAPAPPVPPVLSQAFLSGLPPLPFLPHSLLAAPPLGLDLQRLAAVGLPPHLKPPVIPPLTIPTPPTTTAAAAALLEKILLPNRDVIVKHVDAATTSKIPTSPTSVSKPTTVTENVVPQVEVHTAPPAPTPIDLKSSISIQPQQLEKKGRSRAKSSKTKTQPIENRPKTPPPTIEEASGEKLQDIVQKPKSPVVEVPAVPVELSVPEKPKEVEENVSKQNPLPIEPTVSCIVENPNAVTAEEPASAENPEEPKTKTDDSSKGSEQPATGNSGKTVRKRRKNELASILSDQLLESFKEVDKSALQDLKMMHDMSCEKPDIKFSLEQIPQLAKRKVNPRNPDLIMPVSRHSPVGGTAAKKTPGKKAAKEVAHVEQGEDKAKANDPVQDANSKSEENANVKDPISSIQVAEKVNKVSESRADTEIDKQEIAVDTSSQSITEGEIAKQSTMKKNIKKTTNDDEDAASKVSETSVIPSSFKPNRRTRKLSIDIDRMASLERKNRQKAQYSKELESLDIAQKSESPMDKKSKNKSNKKTEPLKEDTPDLSEKGKEQPIAPSIAQESKAEEVSDAQPMKRSSNKSRSKTPFPFPKEKHTKKSDLDRLKDELNIETPSKKPISVKSSTITSTEESSRTPSPEKKSSKRKVANLEKDEMTKDDDRLTPVKKSKEANELKKDRSASPAKRSKTPVSVKQRTPSPATSPKKSKTPTPPKRIMARRSSVFVDKNLSQYLEQKDEQQEQISNVSYTDDLILTSRRGTRSQGTVDMSLITFFAEAAMKPRDPRRKSAAAVAAAAASAKRAEEERKAAEEERKRREEEKLKEQELMAKQAADNKLVSTPRRISTRRNSVFMTPSTEKEEVKAPEENLVEIVKATKRQYRRRGSVYQSISFLDEEEKQQQEKEATSKATRSKTPGPGGVWDNDIKSVGRRRNQSSVFNGTPEPTIESLLEPLSSPSSGTKRRTKNSQLAENLSKLFNIEEEIQLIDRSKRKPRKTNTPIVFDATVSSSTPIKEAKRTDTQILEELPQAETNKIDVLVKVVETEVAKAANSAPKPRESLSFSNDDEDETPKLNKLVEDIINKSESESDSDDDNMSLACFVRREESFIKPNKQQSQDSLEGIGEDESNSAMDDDVSVTTELTSFGGSIKKRKRRKSICVIKSRRPKPPVDENKPIVTYNCDLCKKVFKKQDAYNKHRMTLSHIAKLSEQEYLEAQRKEQQAAEAASLPSKQDTTSLQSSSTAHPSASSPPKDLEKDNAMKALSQEEKLFYECCSMLKESNADNENLNLTVSLKTDELTPGMASDEIPPPKVSVTYPNPFGSLPQDKANDNCFNMGDSFPSFQDVSESENYIQTINQRYADKHLSDPFAKLTAAEIAQRTENDGNLSPQNSTKSTSSQASVFSQKTIKTKGALKGYDNFKVSIPMTGLHLAKESKLDTLADVALCGDIPKEFEMKDSSEENEGTLPDNASQATQPEQPIAKEDSSRNGLQNTKQTASKKESQGNKLGFRAKKKGSVTPTKAASTTTAKRKSQRKVLENVTRTTIKSKQDADDVYAFQDSPPADNATLQSYTSNKKATANSTTVTAKSSAEQTADQGEESQVSSLSFSDRDDFVYGTNTLSEEDEDDKSSSYSSTQTTPKKPIKADVQKKSLIMGRIFKKSKEKPKEETSTKNATAEVAKEKPKTAAKDFDKLFDTLKKSEAEETADKDNAAQDVDTSTENTDPKLLEDDEKGDRNLRRRSTQKKLTETWDSDEYEDFNLKDVETLIDKKDGKGAGRKVSKENPLEDKGVAKPEQKASDLPSSDNSETAKEQSSARAKLSVEKKTTVTDETIRQVMESVIMEVSMNKNNRAREVKKRGKGRPSKASKEAAKEEENNTENVDSSSKTDSVETVTPEDHVLESSVEISSKTITTKFKQKLNSAQANKQKQPAQKLEKTEEETKKTVNNNNQKAKDTPKTKEQRKDTPEVNKSTTNSAKLKQRKGPPKKMKNVAYDPDSDFEDNIKCKKVKKKLLESDIEANLKIEQLNAALSDSILMPAPRRKRNAAETLYFWSSSSEEDDMEEDFVEVSIKKGKKKKGAAKQKPAAGQNKAQRGQQQPQQQQQQQQQEQQQKQATGAASAEAGDDTSSSSEHMQQHGWIVGDSHKKLVTLLAHAKGKQENRTVKATGNRRKT